jgi:hypothetical protein
MRELLGSGGKLSEYLNLFVSPAMHARLLAAHQEQRGNVSLSETLRIVIDHGLAHLERRRRANARMQRHRARKMLGL